MKTNFHFLLIFSSFISFSQTPINSFYGLNNTVFAIVSSSTPLAQSTSGANITWNFNTLTSSGQSTYTNLTPTASEIATFPNTNTITNVETSSGGTANTTKLYSSSVANVVSLTGVNNPSFTLNYVTNNATLGAFPMNYGFTNNDTTAGNFNYGTYSGTFTGTILTSVDAYGTMSLNATNSTSAFSNVAVTRLKTVQNINLIYGFFGNIGTVNLTTYAYYSATNGNNPIFRDGTTVANVPLLNLNNQTTSQYEVFQYTLLSNFESNFQENKFVIIPNPVQNILHFENSSDIQKVIISDLNGRIVLNQTKFENDIDVSILKTGIYVASIITQFGTVDRKIIKL